MTAKSILAVYIAVNYIPFEIETTFGGTVKNYLLLIKGSFADWNNLSEARKSEVVEKFGAYLKDLGNRGFLRGGDGCSERSFRIMSTSASAEESRVALETKDMVTGYFLFEVPTEDDAINIARSCPAFDFGEYVELVPCSH